MSSKPIIQVENVSKCYQLYDQPADRLKQFLFRGRRKFFKEFWALRNIDFNIHEGEVIGIVGRNGAGKSTLLQLICSTLFPSSGQVQVNGRIAALLELGAGFNPEFSGRENVFMNGAILGLSHSEMQARFDEIVDFSGVRDFIDQPVKTYSSGMYVRLAFSVAIHIEPDILVIDEALSVGDGAFARQSFDKIMSLKDAGKTILFCSHSLYHIEAICNRAIWLERGHIKAMGAAHEVSSQYAQSLIVNEKDEQATNHQPGVANQDTYKPARIINITGYADGVEGNALQLQSDKSAFSIEIEFEYDAELPLPNVAITFSTIDGLGISSLTTYHDDFQIDRGADNRSRVSVEFPNFPLMKGDYLVSVFLGCENALHCYDDASGIIRLTVNQPGNEQGFFNLPHQWHQLE